jgi:hypothetical protein
MSTIADRFAVAAMPSGDLGLTLQSLLPLVSQPLFERAGSLRDAVLPMCVVKRQRVMMRFIVKRSWKIRVLRGVWCTIDHHFPHNTQILHGDTGRARTGERIINLWG